MTNVSDFWQNLIDMIEEEGKKISVMGFDTWVKTIKPFSYKNDTLILSVPMDINRNMIKQRYINLIQSAANILHGKEIEIIIELEDELEKITDESTFVLKNTPIDDNFYLRTGLIKKYTVKECVFGHLHAASQKKAAEGMFGGVKYSLVSCDYRQFMPVKLRD